MELKILGSSSAGNAYLFDNGKEALLVECGVSFKEIQKAVAFDIRRIKGCIVSHEHGDHTRHLKGVMAARIPIYMSEGTAKALKEENNPQITTIKRLNVFNIGGFKIQGFDVQHDAAEPMGYLLQHKETGVTLFATDTYYLKYRFEGLSNILIECNYRKDILDENTRLGIIAKPQRDRTIKSHLSYETCKEILQANDLKKVNNIVLIHLSAANSNAEEFKKGIKELTGKNVCVADKGVTIDINKTPF
ncbi:MAG: MBL fold metallo-hydrolase [Prevotellaceae bacterium]|nr:MBL fold metallo-hydrolase [Prevotella sp.]MDD7272833.1 MBL fold metallo-hydrolase [Prevotellaceae bacterium]